MGQVPFEPPSVQGWPHNAQWLNLRWLQARRRSLQALLGLGVLAGGIAEALITTAAGLAIAIPTHAAYFWLKGRIERFVLGDPYETWEPERFELLAWTGVSEMVEAFIGRAAGWLLGLFIFALGLWLYARAMRARGVLA